MNNNMIHDQLFAMQESVKQSKGIKPKTKQIQAAALGDEIKPGLGDRIVDAIYNPNRKQGAGVQWGTGNNQWYHVPVNPSNTQTASTTTPTSGRRTTPSTSTGLIDEGKPELPLLGMTLHQQILYMIQITILWSLLVLHLMILVIERLEQIDVINYLIKQETHCQVQLL